MSKKQGLLTLFTPEGEEWQSGKGARIPWQVYPRPHLKRDSFVCLNGAWELAVTDKQGRGGDQWETVCVPFVPESPLSGIGRPLPEGATLHYRRTFSLPCGFLRDRVILHVDAADQMAEVLVNGTSVGAHWGGYERFSFDVTDLLQEENRLEILVRDELESGVLPYGKQKKKRGGMWYTPVSGIWQTVWLESVPARYIQEILLRPDLTGVVLEAKCNDGTPCEGRVLLSEEGGDTVWYLTNGVARIEPSQPRCWTPESPHLYEIRIEAGKDSVESYFALRTLTTEVVEGIPRLCLNGKPYFFHGLLDLCCSR